MKNPEEEVKRLFEKPIKTNKGTIFTNNSFSTPSIQLDLAEFPGRRHGSLHMFSPEEWVRVVEVMREYFKNEESKYSFGIYSGDDLKEIVEKYVFDAENVSVEKTEYLIELCIAMLCKLTAEGFGGVINPKEIMNIWQKTNKKEEEK